MTLDPKYSLVAQLVTEAGMPSPASMYDTVEEIIDRLGEQDISILHVDGANEDVGDEATITLPNPSAGDKAAEDMRNRIDEALLACGFALFDRSRWHEIPDVWTRSGWRVSVDLGEWHPVTVSVSRD